MKYISFTFKNIKNFIRHHSIMFIFLIVVQVICCVAVFITCGMANNMYYVEEKLEQVESFSFGFETDAEIRYAHITIQHDDGSVEKYYTPIDPKTGSEIKDEKTGEPVRTYIMDHSYCVSIGESREKLDELIFFLENYDLHDIELMLYYNKTTDIREAPIQFMTYIPNVGTFEKYDSIYLNSSEKIILAPLYHPETGTSIEKYSFYKIWDVANLNGFEYKCVGDSGGFYFIPYNALDDEFVISNMNIYFNQKVTSEDIDEIVAMVNSLFGTNIQRSSAPEPYDPLEKQLSEMVYVISIVVMIIILLAIAKFYNYILSDRKDTLTILRLCGGTRSKVHIIYMLEIFITMIITSSIGFVVFKYLFFDGIAEQYPSFVEFYTPEIYITVFVAYIILAMIIMAFTVIPSTKATIVDMKRRK